MKLFTNKKLIQKMTIVLVILMLFNFIMPNFVKADEGNESAIETAGKVIFTPVRGFFVMCGDAVMNGLQYLFVSNEKAVITAKDVQTQQENFLGEDDTEPQGFFDKIGDWLGKNTFLGDVALNMAGGFEDLPNFKYSPRRIFEGTVPAFDINFISAGKGTSNDDGKNETTDTQVDTSNITNSTWYPVYEKIIKETLIPDLQDARTNGDEDKEKSIIQILECLGVSGARSGDISKISYNPINAQSAVKTLSDKYFNGTNRYRVFGFDPDYNEKSNNYGKDYVDGTMLIGLLGSFNHYSGSSVSNPTLGDEKDYEKEAPINALHDMIATWYKILRNISIIFLLSILVYIGIRIILSSTAADNAKYKKMLVDWVVALCILFVLHYIMAMLNSAVDLVTSAFSAGSSDPQWVDEAIGSVRLKLQDSSLSNQFFYTLIYLVFVIYTVVFTFYYLKRVVYAAFLTLIAPLVALTYPIDRMGDGKSQAFNMWLKEYIANVIIQPVHLLIYTVLIGSVFSLAVNNPLYAIVVMGAMMPAEKFIREMFGLNSQKGLSPAGSFAGGALAASAMNKLLSKPPRMHPHGEHNKSKDNDSENESETKRNKIKMKYSMSDIANSIVGQDVPDVTNNRITDSTKSTENKPDIYDGDFKDSRELDNQNQAENEDIYLPNNKDTSIMDEIKTLPSQEQIDATLKSPMDGDRIEPSLQEKNDANLNSSMDDDTIESPSQEQIDANLKSPMDNNRPMNSQEDKLQQESDNEKLGSTINNNNAQENNNLKMPNKTTVPTSKAEQKQAKKTLKKQKAAAKKSARKRYYAKLTKQRLKALGKLGKGLARGALKTAGAATGIALGATAGIVGGIATGNPENALKFTGAGAIAGAKFGSVIGDDVYNIGARGASGVVSVINSQKEMKQMWQNDLYNTNEEYRKQVDQKEAKKLIKSAETTAMIQQRFGKSKVKEARNAMMEYNEKGIDNIDTMLNCFGLEQGIDSHGNRFAKPGDIKRDQAIMAGRIAEQYDVNSASGRKSSKDDLEHQLANSVYNGSYDGKEYKVSREQAFDKVKVNVNNMMKLADMAQGIDTKHAGLADQLEESNKAKQKRTRAKEVRERMEVENEVARENNNKNN